LIQAIRTSVAIDLKVTGATIVVPAKTGRSFTVTAVWLRKATQSGSGEPATISVGTNASSYNNIVAAVQESAAAANQMDSPLTLVTPRILGGAATAIQVNVSAASTYTTSTAFIYIQGFYE
jgi:uncharacterized protein YaaQ